VNPELRIGDAERDAAISALGEHFAAGRLNHQEYDERTSAAWTARTAADLTALFVDLPAPHPPTTAASHPVANSTTGSISSFTQRAWWSTIGTIPVLVLLVVLALTTRIPWFFIAIFFWFWCARSSRGRWHRSRHRTWHDNRTTS